MDAHRRYRLTNLALCAIALGHGLLTWPLRSVAALFVGGAVIAFVLEAIAVRVGLLEHALSPTVAGVPASVVLAWPAVVYVTLRLALLVVPAGVPAAALAAALATAFDLLADPNGVRQGVWRYPETAVSTPRFRGVPWWNFLAWYVVVFVTALLPSILGG